MRFFFDCVCANQTLFDFTGFDFANSGSAIQFARERVTLAQNCLSREWVGWSLEVSDARGIKVCSLPFDGAAEITVQDAFTDTFVFTDTFAFAD